MRCAIGMLTVSIAGIDSFRRLKQTANRLKIPSLVITSINILGSLGKTFDGYIISNQRKEELILSLGIDQVWFLKTTPEFLRLSGEKFVSCLMRQINMKRTYCRWRFLFWLCRHHGVGDLKRFSLQHDFDLDIVKKKKISGIVAVVLWSGRRIEADFKSARNTWRPYVFIGRVEKGKGFGSKLGFPTANIYPKACLSQGWSLTPQKSDFPAKDLLPRSISVAYTAQPASG